MVLRQITQEKVTELYEFMFANSGMTKCEYAVRFSLTCDLFSLITQGKAGYMSYTEYFIRRKDGTLKTEGSAE